jgi:CDP-glucose 4,6-dehydratase
MTAHLAKSFAGVYQGRRVLLTGHTGFKGVWLSAWLKALGAEVTGLALAPDTTPNHFDLLKPEIDSRLQDVRDAAQTAALVKSAAPEIVFHLAAQPLVRRSYRDPLETLSTNIMGTAHVLEACRQTPSVRAIVVVTTDKCYENVEQAAGYREDDKLGGYDPYSASKACAEIVAGSYRQSFFSAAGAALLATARAGNVIGGGDWSEDRLVPDLVRAVTGGKPLVIRSPKATRPWQHVLEPLSGYLLLGQKLLQGDKTAATAFNFGPDDAGNRPVETVLQLMRHNWPALEWQVDAAPQPHEATLLHLISDKARETLGWRPVWTLEQGIAATATWYRRQNETGDVLTQAQIAAYTQDAAAAGLAWAVA